MLIGVSLGPGDAELVTIKAKKAIEEANEVIVPGKLAEGIVRKFREDVRVVEFPMGNANEVVERLSDELAERCIYEDIAFCVLGDVAFFSTFQDVYSAVRKKNSDVVIEMIPGVPSFTAVFSKLSLFVDGSLKIKSALDQEEKFEVILKATKPVKMAEDLKRRGFDVVQVEKMYMDGEFIGEPKERASYFTMVVGWR